MTLVAMGGTPGGAAGIIPPDSIVLQGATILDWHRRPILHGPTYLYTRHTVRVRCVYNPLLTSASLGGIGSTPSAVRGFRAPLTDVALRHYLSQPRRSIIVQMGPAARPMTVFQSPRSGLTVDARNGPFVLDCDVALISGTKTYLVDLTFQSDINEAWLYVTTPPVIISHRWSCEEDLDQDFYRTRMIHGHAVFNTERLVQLGASPDDFRGYLFHPVPAAHQRVKVQAFLNEDNNELRYTIVDREKALTLVAGSGVTRIEAFHSSVVAKGDLFKSMAGHGKAAAAGAAAGAAAAGPVGAGIGAGLGWGVSFLFSTDREGKGNVPLNTQICEVKVWGDRTSSRRSLAQVALNVLTYRLQNMPENFGASLGWVGEDVVGKFVAAKLSITSGVLDKIVGVFNGRFRPVFPPLPGQSPENLRELPSGETVPDVISGLFNPPLVPQRNPVPPSTGLGGDRGARGTSVEALVAAALQAPNATPPRATGFRRASSLTPP